MNRLPSILLTGGSGLLALNWFYCKRLDYAVYLGLNEREVNPLGSNVLNLDFSSDESFFNQLTSIRPSVLIHTAGLTNVEKCEKYPKLAFHVNVELSCIVARVTKKLGIPLVHISTDHLFEGNASMVSEEEPYNAINEYGRTKALAEKYVSEINPDALIVRSNFYAWGTSYRKSFSDYILDSLRLKKVIYLFDDVFYTPILAENLINIVHDLLDKKVNGIYQVVSDDRISKYEFGILLAEKFGLDKTLIQPSSIKSISNLVERPFDMSLSNKKTKDLLKRNLGSVKQHIARLFEQELEISTKEIQLL